MVLKIGIDDAGRGPIIGPMILAGVLIKEEDESILKNFGVKDSKLLSPKKRDEIAKKLLNSFETKVIIIYPEEIDSRSKSGTNLNWIEAIKSAQIINHLMKDIKDKIKIIIDCPSPNITSWSGYVLKHIEKPHLVELFCEHKADFNHLVCGAASIIAKYNRELEIKKIKETLGQDFGSGYPSDSITMEFLEKNYQALLEKEYIRESWDTWQKLKLKREQRGLF